MKPLTPIQRERLQVATAVVAGALGNGHRPAAIIQFLVDRHGAAFTRGKTNVLRCAEVSASRGPSESNLALDPSEAVLAAWVENAAARLDEPLGADEKASEEATAEPSELMPDFTRGPWEFRNEGAFEVVCPTAVPGYTATIAKFSYRPNAVLCSAATELFAFAEVGIEALQRELAGHLETSCQLDDDLEPIRDTLPADDVEYVEQLEAAIAYGRAAVAKARGQAA